MSMPTQRWKCSSKAVYNIGYHLIWCPKYRRKVLVSPVKERLEILLKEIAESISCEIKTMTIMPEHVHLFVSATPVASPHWIVQQMKGRTSRVLRKEFKHLTTKLPTLWSRSYYCESVGHISEETVKQYIEDQKE